MHGHTMNMHTGVYIRDGARLNNREREQEMMCLKRAKQGSEDAAKGLPLGGQLLPIAPSADDPADHIRVNSFYEIDHSKLPPKSPDRLTSIRLVMVNEKTRMRVSLRFPSTYSLRAYFSEGSLKRPDLKRLPALDEKYIIGSETAAEVLYRRVSPQEIADKKNQWRFWAVPSSAHQKAGSSSSSLPFPSPRTRNPVVSKKGFLCSELKASGMVKWGQRRQVKFLAKHVEEDRRDFVVKSDVKGEEDDNENRTEVSSEGEEEEEDKESEGDEDVKVDKSRDAKRSCKRKRQGTSCITQKKKRPKRENKNNQIVVHGQKKKKKNQIVVYNQQKKKVLRNNIDRWSAVRYKAAEVHMLKTMKGLGAVFGKPILRQELRTEARKLIGDTGLLDHLLKHMAGKVAPGGEERFRRRHNAEGAMEYWLEKADLVDVRREAGVLDPYWTPPPGWKPGDNPTQDPVCAREIKELREDVAKIQRDMEEMVSKQHDEGQAILTTPISSKTSQNMERDNSLIPLKEMYIDLVNKKARIEEQLIEISQSLCGMKEEMEKLKTTVEELNRTETTDRQASLIGSLESTPPKGAEREGQGVARQSKETKKLPESDKASSSKSLPAPTEDKAAKIERLKSGFRICKPQGTFLWPNMSISSPQVAVQLEDLISVPTPPSVSSSAPQLHLLSSTPTQHLGLHLPIFPVRRPVPVAPSTASRYENIATTSTAINTTKTSIINLNEPPNNQTCNRLSGSQSDGQTSYSVTYQRRHHQNVTTTTCMPHLEMREGSSERQETMSYSEQQQQLGRYSASSTYSCLPSGAGSWLAMATTSNPSSTNKSKRG